MYQVNEALCRGCAACVEVCPEGAIALINSIAHIAADRCTDCGACAEACPEGAIRQVEPVALASTAKPALAVSPSVQPEPAVIRVESELLPTAPSVTSWRSRLWPAVGSALLWAGRELLPALLAAWRESVSSLPTQGATEGATSRKSCLAGRQARRRWRWRSRR